MAIPPPYSSPSFSAPSRNQTADSQTLSKSNFKIVAFGAGVGSGFGIGTVSVIAACFALHPFGIFALVIALITAFVVSTVLGGLTSGTTAKALQSSHQSTEPRSSPPCLTPSPPVNRKQVAFEAELKDIRDAADDVAKKAKKTLKDADALLRDKKTEQSALRWAKSALDLAERALTSAEECDQATILYQAAYQLYQQSSERAERLQDHLDNIRPYDAAPQEISVDDVQQQATRSAAHASRALASMNCWRDRISPLLHQAQSALATAQEHLSWAQHLANQPNLPPECAIIAPGGY